MPSVRGSRAGTNATHHAVICFVLVLATLIPDSASAEVWQSRFLDECLTPGATPFTAEFNAYHADSYVVNKLQLVEALPRAARERGLKLRGSLIAGPLGPLWSYHIFTFLEEGGWVRVNALVMPHARITGKATALLTPRQFKLLSQHLHGLSFARSARDTRAVRVELSPKQTSKQAEFDPEWEFAFLFAEFAPQQSSLLFGSLQEHAGSEQRQLSAVLRPLTDSLVPTYQHGERHPAAVPKKKHFTFAFSPLIGFQRDPLPELNRALAELGYVALDSSEHWLGVGMDISWRGLRLNADLAVALPRLAPHATGADAQASFRRQRIAVRVGYDILAEPEFRVFPMLGLRSGMTTLSRGSEQAGPLELEQTFESVELALGFDGHIPLSRWLYKPWLVVGARVGHVLASWPDNWETTERNGVGEMPGAPESSFFGIFMFGLGFEGPDG